MSTEQTTYGFYRDLLRRHDRLAHSANSETEDVTITQSSGSQASPPSQTQTETQAQTQTQAEPHQMQTEQVPHDIFIEETLSSVQQVMSMPGHDAAGGCPPLPLMDYDLDDAQLVVAGYLDDFKSFMDNVPIPNSVFSPSYQPSLQTFLPGSAEALFFEDYTDSLRDDELVFPSRIQHTDDSTVGSTLSAYGSRLPSLQPEERPESSSVQGFRSQKHRSDSGRSNRRGHAHLTVSEEDRERAMQELSRFASYLPADHVLPSKHALSRFVSAYITVFNEHYPFLHVPTLCIGTMRVELFLAIVAVGARYSREPEASNELFHLAKVVSQERLRRRHEPDVSNINGSGSGDDMSPNDGKTSGVSDDSRYAKLETMQALCLLIAIATWFKRQPDVYEALSIRSILDTLVREDTLQHERAVRPRSWKEWVRYETLKRTRLVIFCFFSIHTIVFDMPPMMLADQLRQDLPCAENEWKASSEQEWLGCHDDGITQEDSKTVLERLFEPWEADRNCLSTSNLTQVNSTSTQAGFSSLGGCVLIHAIIQRIWLVRNSGFHCGPTTQQLSPEMMKSFERALKCWSSCWELGRESSMDPLSPHGPLSFTSTALLRLAYIRINMDLGPIRSLGSWDPNIIARSLDSSPPAQRSHRMTRAALHCAHALSIPVKLGINYVAQTQVVYWSNQHALCSLECAVLLAKWLDAVTVPEPNPPLNAAESRMLHFVVQLVAEAHYKGQTDKVLQDKGPFSLASTVVRLWASLYKAESVWEMVDLIARSLNAFADLLEVRGCALQASVKA